MEQLSSFSLSSIWHFAHQFASQVMVPLFMIFGPMIGYVPQYQQIAAARSIGSFSVPICFILLTANVLRVYYWIGERFDLTLLLQSLVMIIIQLTMLQLVHRYLPQRATYKGSKYRFWEWTDYELFSTGTKYILACMTILTIVNVRFLDWRWVVEWTGFLALLIEAMLPLPQFIRNSRSRSVEGLSFTLISTWFLGDAFKTVYYYLSSAPVYFLLCGLFQLVMDTLILLQFFIYSRPSDASTTKYQRTSRHAPATTETTDGSSSNKRATWNL